MCHAVAELHSHIVLPSLDITPDTSRVTGRVDGHDAAGSLVSQRGANGLAWCWN